MDQFIEFLGNSKKAIASVNFSKSNVHVVMGNESCDLDSMNSALALAYLYYRQNLKTSTNVLVLPVLNILSSELPLRTENCYVLNQLNIDKSSLIFRDTINLEEIQNNRLLKLTIVDHHVLADKDKCLQDSLVAVFDHRPKDPQAKWDDKIEVILSEVGSCATLIGNELLEKDPDILNETVSSLLYDTIVFDTIGFNPDADKVKELDISIFKKLEKVIKKDRQDSKKRYQELWQAHNNVSHLTARQLLSKDLKFIGKLPIPGLPMLVQDFLKLPGVMKDIESFCNEINFSTVVLMGLHVIDDVVYRDIGVFAKDDKLLQNKITSALRDSQEFCVEEHMVEVPNFVYFKQKNIKMSRKQLLPIIKSALET